MTIAQETIKLTQGSPTNDMVPHQMLIDATAKAYEQYGMSMMHYGDVWGFGKLREWLGETNNFPVEDIIVGNGSISLLSHVVTHYLHEGDRVLVENPTYFRAKVLFNSLNTSIVPVTLDDDGMNIEELEQAIIEHKPRLLYMVADFHNPTGVTTSLEKRQKIAELAEQHDILIYEDSAYYSLRYFGEDIPQVRTFAPDHTITSGSFSKLLTPGLRTGWIQIPHRLTQNLGKYIESRIISPNFFTQAIVANVVTSSAYAEHLDTLHEVYRHRRDNAFKLIQEYLEPLDVKWSVPEGGFFIGLWFPHTNVDIWDTGAKQGLTLINGDKFYIGKEHTNFVRLPFCSATEEELEIGVQRLATSYEMSNA